MKFRFAAPIAALAALPVVLLPVAAAHAQAAPAQGATARTPRPVETVLTTMGKDAGLTVIADGTVMKETVIPPATATTPDNVEAQLTTLVRRLPSGTQWVKIMLPALPGSRTYKGDDVADYALAQAKLFGNVGAATPAGVVEILGQRVKTEQAAPVVSTLALKVVYLVTNPSAKTALSSTGLTANWAQMTPDQQKAYAAQQVQNIRSMTPTQRADMMQQQRAVMMQYFQSMTPEEQQQMRQGMGGRGPGGGGRMGRGGGN